MATGTEPLLAAGATAIVKKVIDDLYVKAKELGIHHLAKARSDVRDVSIARALASLTKVKTLWNVEKEVSLYEFHYPTSVQFPDGAEKQITSLRDFGPLQHFVIQGTAGQGKSIFLRYLTGQELIPSRSSGRVPIFVQLRRLRPDLHLDALIAEALQKFKLPHTPLAWSFLAGSGKFVLLLDAFDEIDPALTARAIADIESLCDHYSGSLQILVTSRPDADIQRCARFRVCKLSPLGPDDHLPFLKKICQEKGQAESLHGVLTKSSTEIRDLLTTPLMLTLLVILYKAAQTVPDTVPKFYEELFDVLFYRHDHSKPGFRRKRFTNLDDGKIKAIFSAFCFYARLKGLGVFTNVQLAEIVNSAGKSCNENVDPEKFKDELTKTVCLMQQDGFEYSFIHKSVAQYYAASFVRSSSDGFAEKFYELAAKPDHVWDLELRFLEQIDTYRYTKLFYLPRLNAIASGIAYSFSGPSPTAAVRLNEHLASLTYMTVPTDAATSGLTATYSAHDATASELSSGWIPRIFAALLTSGKMKEQLRARALKDEHSQEEPWRVRLADALDILNEHIPELGEESLRTLQAKYEHATKILETENEKTALLAAML